MKKWIIRVLTGIVLLALCSSLSPQVNIPQNLIPTVGQDKITFTIGTEVYAAGIADYTCDGTDDNIQIQQAMDALPATGGKIVILAGNYSFSAIVSRAIDNITIQGTGMATYFARDGGSPLFSAGVQSNWVFRDFSTDAGGIIYLTSTNYILENINIGTTYYAYRTDASADEWCIPTGRTATFTVAASDSSNSSKAQADYVCDGTADNVEIQAAIDALPAGGGEIAVLGANLAFSNKVSIDLATKRVSIRGQNTLITSTCATGIPCFEIINNPAGLVINPTLSGFRIEGTVASTGRVGVVIKDCLYCPTLEHLDIRRCDKAIVVDKGTSSQIEGLILRDIHLSYNNYGIYLAPTANASDTCQSRLEVIDMIVPADGVGLYIGNNMALGRSYLEIMVWLVGNNAKGIFNDGSLTGSFLNYKCEGGGSYTGRIAIDVGTNAQAGHSAQCEFHNGMNSASGEIWVNDPFGKKLLFEEPGRPQLELSSFNKADIIVPFIQGAAQQGTWAYDYSNYGNHLTLLNNPTWGSLGRLGKVTFNGTTQYSTTPNITLSGSRTFVMVVSPDFLETENVQRQLVGWAFNANNNFQIHKTSNAGGNIVRAVYTGGGVVKAAGIALGFAQNEVLVLIFTYNDTTRVGTFYSKGISKGSFSDATTIEAGASLLSVYAYVDGSLNWKGSGALFAQMPYALTSREVRQLTKELAYLAGLDLVLENSGTATMLINEGAIVVNHGLSDNVTRVQVAMTSNPGLAVSSWIDTYTATQFTIHTSANVTAATTFDWRAVTGEGN